MQCRGVTDTWRFGLSPSFVNERLFGFDGIAFRDVKKSHAIPPILWKKGGKIRVLKKEVLFLTNRGVYRYNFKAARREYDAAAKLF